MAEVVEVEAVEVEVFADVVPVDFEANALLSTVHDLLSRKKRIYCSLYPLISSMLMNNREADQRSESENASEEEEDESPSEDESTDEEEELLPTVRPYSALIQSLAASSAPQAKRRKLDHPQPGNAAETVSDDNSETPEKLSDETDDVDEEEEGPDTTADALLEDDDDDDSEDSHDPFEVHFANPDGNLLSQKLKALQQSQWTTQKLIIPNVGKAVFSTPQEVDRKNVALVPSVSGPTDLKLKLKLAGAAAKQWHEFNPMERNIAAYMFNYHDILYCERKPSNSDELRRLACLHAVNHVFKSVDSNFPFSQI